MAATEADLKRAASVAHRDSAGDQIVCEAPADKADDCLHQWGHHGVLAEVGDVHSILQGSDILSLTPKTGSMCKQEHDQHCAHVQGYGACTLQGMQARACAGRTRSVKNEGSQLRSVYMPQLWQYCATQMAQTSRRFVSAQKAVPRPSAPEASLTVLPSSCVVSSASASCTSAA